MQSKISINVKNYFEGSVYFLGWMMLLSGFIAIIPIWYIGLILVFLGVMIVTSRFILVVDPDKKIIDDYLSIFGAKTKHEQFRYKQLKHITINKSKFNQQLNYKSISTHINGMLYSAWLVCDNQKHFLGDSQDLSKLRTKLDAFAQKAGLQVKDHSGG